MPSDERHAHSFCPVQKKPPDLELGRKGGRARTDLLRGRCQVTRRRRIFSILSIISSPRSGLDRNSFNSALAVRALRSIRPDISSTTKLFYDGGGPRGIACQRPSISVFLPSWHSSKFAPGMKQELKKGGAGRKGDWKAPINKTPLVAAAALHLLRASTKHHALLVSPRRRQFPSRNLWE